MNNPEYQKLAIHYDKAKRVKKRIESIERVIHSMRNEIKDGGENFHVWVTRAGQHRHNISTDFTANTFKAVMLPLLKLNLAELRKEFKAIPPMAMKETKE